MIYKIFRFFHENYSINQATNKSKIILMENKRLSTIASLTIIIKRCERFFNGCRTCFLYIFLLLLRISSNVLRLFPFKGRRLAPFSENFQKEQDLNTMSEVGFFLCPMQLSSFCVGQHLSSKRIFLNFFVRKKVVIMLFVKLMDGRFVI
jgi:hypothetical protein